MDMQVFPLLANRSKESFGFNGIMTVSLSRSLKFIPLLQVVFSSQQLRE